jgi:hypothetical protein
MDLPEVDDEFLEALNEILASHPGPMGAYCMGILTKALIDAEGIYPSRIQLERASKCERVAEAWPLIDSWLADIRELRKRAGKRKLGRPPGITNIKGRRYPAARKEG